MAKYDRISTLFWICIALGICIESVRLGPGSLSNPGPGLVPLSCGCILGIFGLIVLVLSLKEREKRTENLWESATCWGKLISVVVSVTAYALLMNTFGFLLMTFFWMGYVCWRIGKMKLRNAVFVALVTTFSAYFLFKHYLNILFPGGILGL
jgi:hypothetical protein